MRTTTMIAAALLSLCSTTLAMRSDGTLPWHVWRLKSDCEPGPVPAPLDVGDYMRAFNELGKWCDAGNKVPANSIQKFTSGNVQAFVCSFGGENPCSSKEIEWVYYLSKLTCRKRYIGWDVEMPLWRKGYGVYSTDTDPKEQEVCTGADSILWP